MSDDVTRDENVAWMLARLGEGVSSADQLSEIYGELRKLAGAMMRSERADHTLQATALVNEAFLRLASSKNLNDADRLKFLDAAAVAMRRILVDHARRSGAQKRGGTWERITLQALPEHTDTQSEELDITALQAALEKFEKLDARAAKIVELRFFAGMTGDEISAHLDVSRSTVVRELTVARAWLRQELDSAQP